jgi:uncharacterized protein with HEPN domain
MRLEAQKYLFDIRRAADRIARFCEGRTFDSYRNDELLRSAVERQFEIMGEALSQLARHAPDVAGKIQDHRKIIAFRNILIHAYATVDDRIVWGVIEGNLPALRASLAALLPEPPGA